MLVLRMFSRAGCAYVGVLLLAMLTAGCGSLRAVKTTAAQPPAPRDNAPSKMMAATLEVQDGRLAAALLAVAAAPRAETYRHLAREYRRLGVLDKAHEHFSNAVTADPTDATAYDALARIWRDWGAAPLGLADAYRAVHHAPQSAAAANTLGTLLQAVGRLEDAQQWYARAVALDPAAWYALNNLCYIAVLSREAAAVNICHAAVAGAPGVKAKVAQNNLALAHVAAGDRAGAKAWFRRAGEPATASYNYGIAMMATGSFKEATAAFEEALRADPQFTMAAMRARQASLAARAEDLKQ
jgi:tetratricopeptide (TPR) repeat protein